MKIGVLALQGDFKEHLRILSLLNMNAIEVRNKSDLSNCSALIVPGGESTTISNLMALNGMDKEIKLRVKKGMGYFGTCAGAIVAAKKVISESRFKPMGLIDVSVERNAFGSQVDSFESEVSVKGIGNVNGIFIRAPDFVYVGKGVEVLAKLNGKPVLVHKDNILLSAFHPETDSDSRLHNFFLKLI